MISINSADIEWSYIYILNQSVYENFGRSEYIESYLLNTCGYYEECIDLGINQYVRRDEYNDQM